MVVKSTITFNHLDTPVAILRPYYVSVWNSRKMLYSYHNLSYLVIVSDSSYFLVIFSFSPINTTSWLKSKSKLTDFIPLQLTIHSTLWLPQHSFLQQAHEYAFNANFAIVPKSLWSRHAIASALRIQIHLPRCDWPSLESQLWDNVLESHHQGTRRQLHLHHWSLQCFGELEIWEVMFIGTPRKLHGWNIQGVIDSIYIQN